MEKIKFNQISDESFKSKLKDLSVTIKKKTQPSDCVPTFFNLLIEINEFNPDYIDTVMKDMNKFIEDFVILVKETDKITSQEIKSRVCHKDFILSKKYFNKTFRALKSIYPSLTYNPHDLLSHQVYLESNVKPGSDPEQTRKSVLLWNYIPAIVKAMIQTQRRSYGFDNNSKRFV